MSPLPSSSSLSIDPSGHGASSSSCAKIMPLDHSHSDVHIELNSAEENEMRRLTGQLNAARKSGEMHTPSKNIASSSKSPASSARLIRTGSGNIQSNQMRGKSKGKGQRQGRIAPLMKGAKGPASVEEPLSLLPAADARTFIDQKLKML